MPTLWESQLGAGPKYHLRFLQQELQRRKSRNRLYSSRAFAMHLGVHFSALSRILNGKQELSPRAAIAVAERICASEQEKRSFLSSIAAAQILRTAQRLSVQLETPLELD